MVAKQRIISPTSNCGYFYDTKTVGSETQWQDLLNNGISQPMYSLGDDTYERVWDAVGEISPPVAMTETTYRTRR